MSRAVERELAALGGALHRREVREVAAHRLGTDGAERLGRPLCPCQRAHGPAVGDEPPHERPADETGATGDERREHERNV